VPTSTTLKVMHFAKKESHRLTAAKCATYNISLNSVNRIICSTVVLQIIKYDPRLKCMLVRCGPAHYLVVV